MADVLCGIGGAFSCSVAQKGVGPEGRLSISEQTPFFVFSSTFSIKPIKVYHYQFCYHGKEISSVPPVYTFPQMKLNVCLFLCVCTSSYPLPFQTVYD